MLHKDMRAEAEAFIDKVVAPTKQPDPTRSRAIEARAKLMQDDLQIVRRELAASGIDVDRLDRLAAERPQSHSHRGEEGDDGPAHATHPPRNVGPLYPTVLPAEPNETVIDEVTFIRSFIYQGQVLDSNIAPGDNWARYRVKSQGYEGTGRLSFFVLWQNPLDDNVLVTPRVDFAVNARLSLDAGGGGIGSWFGIGESTKGSVRVRLVVWGMSAEQRSVVHEQELSNASVSGGFWGDSTSRSISFSDVLQGSGVIVTPRAYMLFEVEVETAWDLLDGSVTLDAEKDPRRVTLSRLVLGGVSPQPQPQPSAITLTGSSVTAAGGLSVTLNWSGATGARVDIYQDNVKIGDTENDGSWNGFASPASHQYRVCETATATCSNTITVSP